jgi:precorrin-3B synthase
MIAPSPASTSAAYRRHACPGLADPMATGDGLLARLVPSGKTIALDAFAAVCTAASTLGNGIIEITARGSLQVRGLRPDTIALFSSAVGGLAIAADGIPIVIDPLAGLEPNSATDASMLAAELRTALSQSTIAARLGPKISVAIDGGNKLHLDQIPADIRLRLEQTPEGARLHVMIGGDAAHATAIGAIAPADATVAILRILEVIAKCGRNARARDIIGNEGSEPFRAALGTLAREVSPVPSRPRSQPIGLHRLNDGTAALGLGLAFGHSDAAALLELIEAAGMARAPGVRTAPDRTLLVIGISAAAASDLAATAERLGFVSRPDDPRRFIAACAGAPVCSSAQMPSRTLAPQVAKSGAQLLDGSFTLHLSGCTKGCAQPAENLLTFVGNPGSCGIVINGAASATPAGNVAVAELASGLAMLANDIARVRRDGESIAAVLARLGPQWVTSVLSKGRHV